MDSGDCAARIEAELMLGLAEKLLASGDFAGSRNLAERALESNPLLLNGAEQVIAVADALLSSQILINNHINSYAVLHLDPSVSAPTTIRAHYARLTRRLRPAKHRLPFAAEALRIVSDAFHVLSDPSKKSLLDAQSEERASFPSFWTSCHSCCYAFQYDRAYLGRMLRCQTCRQVFAAAELAAPPPVVPGTNTYYCSWVFAPIGYIGNSGGEFNPFYPLRPFWASGQSSATGGEGNRSCTTPSKATPVKVKAVAKKSARNFKKISFGDSKLAPEKRMRTVATKTVERDLKKLFSGQIELRDEQGSASAAVIEDCEEMEVNPVVMDYVEETRRLEEEDGTGSFDIELDDADLDATGDLLSKMIEFPCSSDEHLEPLTKKPDKKGNQS